MTQELKLRCERIEGSLVQVRQRVGDVLSSRSEVDRSIVDDMVLVVVELAANAVEHGAGHSVDVTLTFDDGAIAVAVTNEGVVDLGDPAGWTMPPPEETAGRGLALVRALSDDVWWAAADGRLSVHARRAVA